MGAKRWDWLCPEMFRKSASNRFAIGRTVTGENDVLGRFVASWLEAVEPEPVADFKLGLRLHKSGLLRCGNCERPPVTTNQV
jgi:hypothetical protein